MKKEYKMDNGSWCHCASVLNHNKFMFTSEAKAWNTLRTAFPDDDFVTLYVLETIPIFINQHDKVIAKYNEKYTTKMDNRLFLNRSYWKPIVYGLSTDKFETTI